MTTKCLCVAQRCTVIVAGQRLCHLLGVSWVGMQAGAYAPAQYVLFARKHHAVRHSAWRSWAIAFKTLMAVFGLYIASLFVHVGSSGAFGVLACLRLLITRQVKALAPAGLAALLLLAYREHVFLVAVLSFVGVCASTLLLYLLTWSRYFVANESISFVQSPFFRVLTPHSAGRARLGYVGSLTIGLCLGAMVAQFVSDESAADMHPCALLARVGSLALLPRLRSRYETPSSTSCVNGSVFAFS